MKIDPPTFDMFSRLISDRCGIKLADNRQQMLQNRILNRVRQLGLSSYRDYFTHVSTPNNGGELDALVDAVTTNYTLFFRDPGQFDHMHDRVVKILEQQASGARPDLRIRIWSAACSTGEEAYSLAITAKKAAESTGHSADNIRVLATDIASSVLATASQARYRKSAVDRLAVTDQMYFEPVDDVTEGPNQEVIVREDIRKMVIFRKMNLCNPKLHVPDNIDIIFCRNVLLYFAPSMQGKILGECSQTLRPGGWLYVGACESVRQLVVGLNPIGPSIFQRPITEKPPTDRCAAPSMLAMANEV